MTRISRDYVEYETRLHVHPTMVVPDLRVFCPRLRVAGTILSRAFTGYRRGVRVTTLCRVMWDDAPGIVVVEDYTQIHELHFDSPMSKEVEDAVRVHLP